MLPKTLFLTALLAAGFGGSANAQEFRLSSPSVREGGTLDQAQVFKGFGCDGGNLSPQLSWANPPKAAKSFAITVYDPDAPTGSGWWHWNVVNIPSHVTALPANASGSAAMPAGSLELRNDYGTIGFGGACPPPGEMHRYVFTVHALGVEKLDLPKDASNALAGFMIRAHSIGQAKMTAIYHR